MTTNFVHPRTRDARKSARSRVKLLEYTTRTWFWWLAQTFHLGVTDNNANSKTAYAGLPQKLARCPIKGVIVGGGELKMSVSVDVAPAEAEPTS